MPRPKKSTPPSRRFTGVLAEPIRIKVFHHSIAGMMEEEAKQRNAQEAKRAIETALGKLDALFRHFGIERNRRPATQAQLGETAEEWASLALQLAHAFVPGFQIVAEQQNRERGRPKVPELDHIRLLADLELIKRSQEPRGGRAMSDAQAAVKLTQEAPYNKRWGTLTAQAIQNKMRQARDPKRNPLARFWQQEGEVGVVAREFFVRVFDVTKIAV